MLNLNRRVNNLLEKTTSLECKNVCKEIIETYSSIPEEQIAASIIEKLKTIKDADKHVNGFIQISEKYLGIRNLGIAKAISTIRESQSYHYPALRYTLDKYERQLVEGLTQDYLVIEEFAESLKDFTWDKNVKDCLESIKEKIVSQKETILIAKSVYELKKTKGNFMFDNIVERLENHFDNPTQSSRSGLIDELGRFSFNGTVKKLIESLKKIQSLNGSLQIIAENSSCDVSQVFSPLILENGREYFTIKKEVYRKTGELIEKVASEEFNNLSESIKRSYQVINSPYFFVKGGKASFYIGRNKVEILENENKKQVLFNGKEVPASDIARNLMSTGMLRLEEAKVASDIQFVSDIFENFFELDFAKVISSKRFPGSYVNLMKVNEKIYLNKVNESMKSNEFFTDLNSTQARNLILEFLGFDIAETFSEYIEKEQAQILEIKSKQSEILKSMSIVESEISKIEGAKKDPYLANNPQVKSLEEMLKTEITNLRNSYQQLSSKLKQFEAKSSDSGLEIGEDVKITSTGELATVNSIDNKTITVITANGKTVELTIDKVTPVAAEEEKALEKNAKKGEAETSKVDEKKKEKVEVETEEEVETPEEEVEVKETPEEEEIDEKKKVKVEEETPEEEEDKEVEEAPEDVETADDDVEDEEIEKIEEEELSPRSLGEEDMLPPTETTSDETSPEYVTATVTTDQGGTCAGKEVKILALDFTSKGPEDLIQAECDGDTYFIEKKSLQIPTTEGDDSMTIDFDAEPPAEDEKEVKKKKAPAEEAPAEEAPAEEAPAEEAPAEEAPKEKLTPEELQSKLAKALKDLESIRDDMADTFSKNENVSSTINGLKGMIDAMKSSSIALSENIKPASDILAMEDYIDGLDRISALKSMIESTAKGSLKENLQNGLSIVESKFRKLRVTAIESLKESVTPITTSNHLYLVMGFIDLAKVMEGLSIKYTEVAEDLKTASTTLKNGALLVEKAISSAMEK
jgi:hypothetical protein